MYDFLPEKILQNYADLMVNFAANERKGAQKGDVVVVKVPESASIMLKYFQRSILKAGAFGVYEIMPEGLARDFFEMASPEQLNYYDEDVILAKNKQTQHVIYMKGTNNPLELVGVDPKKIEQRSKLFSKYSRELMEKFDRGDGSWTLALFGTKAMAEQAKMSLKDYWDEIIHACFLDKEDPVKCFDEIFNKIDKVSKWLDGLNIQKVHVVGEDVDLHIGIGSNRKWIGGSGHNIPSFEVFTSPDFTQTEGYIKFNQPLYYAGNVIRDIELKFEKGKVVEFDASENKDSLAEMIAHKGANMVGEFSMTDRRFSRITKFMANTLYDENVGGKYGNSHIALGNAYKTCFKGDFNAVEKLQWEKMGYNESDVHTDIVTTTNRTVTAELEDGSQVVIYKDGQFTLEI